MAKYFHEKYDGVGFYEAMKRVEEMKRTGRKPKSAKGCLGSVILFTGAMLSALYCGVCLPSKVFKNDYRQIQQQQEKQKQEPQKPQKQPKQGGLEKISADEKAINLLANIIYSEARGCSDEEKIAIAYVPLNWAEKRNRPLIEELSDPVRYDGLNHLDGLKDKKAFEHCLKIAEGVLKGEYSNKYHADHFYSGDKAPYWAKNMKHVKSNFQNFLLIARR